MKANSRTPSQDTLPTVAAINSAQRDRSSSSGRSYRSSSQVHFKIPISRSQSSDSNYRQNNSYERGRSTERRLPPEHNNFRPPSRSPGPPRNNPRYGSQPNNQTGQYQGPIHVQNQYPSTTNLTSDTEIQKTLTGTNNHTTNPTQISTKANDLTIDHQTRLFIPKCFHNPINRTSRIR